MLQKRKEQMNIDAKISVLNKEQTVLQKMEWNLMSTNKQNQQLQQCIQIK